MVVDCCGQFLCRGCDNQCRREKEEEAEQRLANLKVGTPSFSPKQTHTTLVGISCIACGTTAATSTAERFLRLKRLADAGHVHAQLSLGRIYMYGQLGVPKDTEEGMMWMKKAAETGHTTACALLGEYFHRGHDGLSQSYQDARLWYERGQSNAVVLVGLGTLYRDGKGVEKDETKALELFRRSALQNYPRGLLSYGFALYTAERFDEALVQFEKGARMEVHLCIYRRSIAFCQLYVAHCLLNIYKEYGQGKRATRGNDPLPLALFWARRSLANRNEKAKGFVDEMDASAHSKCRGCGKPNPKDTCSGCRAASYCGKVSWFKTLL